MLTHSLQQPFHPDLEAAIDVLKEAIAKENWETKGKFPPSLKPVLAQVALKAVILGEYDDNFFNLMPRLFPYNKFTMTVCRFLTSAAISVLTIPQKLVKRTIWRDHTNLLVDRQNSLIEELRVLADEGFPKAKEEWEKSVVQWGTSVANTTTKQLADPRCRETAGTCKGRTFRRARTWRCTLYGGLPCGQRPSNAWDQYRTPRAASFIG